MNCPKCDFAQPDGLLECPRCGVVFSHLHAATPPAGPVPERPLPTFNPRSALAETQSLYVAKPFALLLTGFAFLPLLVAVAVAPPPTTDEQKILAGLGILAYHLVCASLVTAMVSVGVSRHLRRRDTSLSASLKVRLGSLWSAIFVGILRAMTVFAGLCLGVVPGLILHAKYAVAVPAAVEERLRPFAALTRSAELTAGYRPQIFGLLWALGVIGNSGRFLAATGASDILRAPGRAILLLTLAASAAASGLAATNAAVMYYRLRSAKEAIDVEDLASVFD